MGAPAARMGDQITGSCTHLVPGPAGTPVSTVMPFTAQLTDGLASTVLIGGQPAAVRDATGLCVPPHPGIVDAFAPPPTQRGTVMSGSVTVLLEDRPAARSGSPCRTCTGNGTLTGTAPDVQVGG